LFCHGFGRRRRRGVVRLGHVGGARSLADMLLDPAIDFCGDRSDDHAAAALKGALMSAAVRARSASVCNSITENFSSFAAALTASLSSARNQEAWVNAGSLGVP
jgi:hypothetical protein